MNAQAQPGDQSRPGAAGDQGADQAQNAITVSVKEAAQRLGTTVEGVRSRIKRGSLNSMKVQGTVYVLLDPDQIDQAQPNAQSSPGAQSSPDAALYRLVDEQRDMINWLKGEVERKDTIIMQMAQRIPELEPAKEAPRDERESPVRAEGAPYGTSLLKKLRSRYTSAPGGVGCSGGDYSQLPGGWPRAAPSL